MRLQYFFLLLTALCCVLICSCGKDAQIKTCVESAAVSQADEVETPAVKQIQPPAENTGRTLAVAGPGPEAFDVVIQGDSARFSWLSLLPGDYNVDGETSGLDVFPLAANFDEPVAGNPGNECVDGNGDGTLNGQDLFLIAVNFQKRISGYDLFDADDEGGPFEGVPLNAAPIAYVGCDGAAQYDLLLVDDGPWFAIRAYDTVDDQHSAPSAAKQLPDPMGVSGLTWRGDDGAFDIAWLPETARPDEFDHWEIEMKPDGVPVWIQVDADYRVNTGDPDYGLVIFPSIGETNGADVGMRVRAVDDTGNIGPWSELLDIGPSEPPEPPTGPLAFPGDSKINISFMASVSADRIGYNVYRSLDVGGPYERVSTKLFDHLPPDCPKDDAGTIGWQDGDLENEHQYWYKIRTIDDRRVESADSAIANAWASLSPDTPEGVSAHNLDGAVKVDWQDNSEPDLQGYRVYMTTTPGPPYEQNRDVTMSEITWDGLINEQDYYFTLRARDTYGVMSDLSVEVNGHPSEAPATPTGLAGIGRYLDTEIYLSWDEPQGADLVGLDIRRSMTPGGPQWDQVAYILPTRTAYTFEDMPRATTYYYRLRVVDSWGVPSEWSSEIEVTTPDWQWEIVEQGGQVGDFSSIVIDGDGTPWIAYYDSANLNPKCATYNGAAWETDVVFDIGNAGVGASIGILSNGKPGISYLSATDESVRWGLWNGSNWANSPINSDDGPFREITSMDQDSLGKTGVALVEQGGGDLFYGYHEGGPDWDWRRIDSDGDGFIEPCLAFDHADMPQISVRGWSSESLKLVRWNGADWEVQTVASGGDIGRMSSLAFDYLGNPVIAHGDTALNLEWFNGVSWDHTTVDDSDQGRYPSLVLQDGRHPIISYRHQAEGDLFMAWYKEGTWEIEELRTGSGSCSYTSIALDALGNPVISLAYYYGGPRSLAVAWFK